ncbi:MAG TPA: PKD domain-containing protein [Bacteroidales bacterium]|nr:PKD domain-containing protein [Bacteroidales bacterium]
MKKGLLLSTVLLLAFLSGRTQTTPAPAVNDTANYPYWIEMMQDPNANFFQTQRAFNLYWKDRKITRGCGWKVFKRWEYMMQSRINPDGSRPAPDATFRAYSEYEKSVRSANGTWAPLGPAMIPSPGPAGYEGLGRVNVVAWHPTDPNKMYVGAPSGGLWQSADGGSTWVTHTDSLATLGVSAVVVDYSNPNRILIGTGDRDAGDAPGLGTFVSNNGGLSWTLSNTGMGNKTVNRIIQHPTNPLVFLAATSSAIYRSSDGGTNWTSTQSGNFKDIVFKTDDPNIVFASAGGNFYRSTNNGTTWVKINSGLNTGSRGVIAVTPANPSYVYFMQCGSDNGFKEIFRSTDAGLSFVSRSTSPNILGWSCDGSDSGGQGWYDLALAADPVNPNIVFAGGVDVWKSIDGGTTWAINSHWYGGCNVPAVHADCHFLGYSPVDGKLYAGNDGGCWATADGGTTWTDRTEGMTIGQIYKIGQAATIRNKVINGFQDNGTYMYTPTGWVATGGGDGMECAVDYVNPIFTYHTVYYGDIYRRTNNSSEAHIAGDGINGITESGAWVTPFSLNTFNHKGMFIGYKNIWRANNVTSSPINFVQISNNLAGNNGSDMSVIEQSWANPNLFFAARSDGKTFRSENVLSDMPTWVELTSFMPATGTPTDITTHPTNENIVYVTIGTKVFKSSDKGVTWTDLTDNLPSSVAKNTIAYYKNAPEGLYVGTDAGVYYRDTTTAGWIPFKNGLPVNGRITELEIYYDDDSVSQDVLRASTYGRGLWSSDLYHAAPDADFITAHTTVPTGCAVDFQDISTGVPTYFRWEFPGGNPAFSTLKNPANIVYSAPGNYTVKLKVWNEFGADSIIKPDYIHVDGTLLPQVDFSASPKALCNSYIVRFTDLTANCPSAWQWSFNPATIIFLEGTTASSQNPVVSFTEPGVYDVQLTCTNANGSNSLTKIDYIVKDGYRLPFTDNFSGGFGERQWEINNPDLGITWDTITVGGLQPGSKAIYMNFFDYQALNRRDQLISPALNFTGYSNVILSFRHAYEQRVRKDSLIIRLSTDCGATWQRIWGMGPDGTPNTFVTHPSTDSAFYPQSADDWCGGSYGTGCYSIDLSAWAGQPNIKLLFESYNRFGNNLFLSDIHVGAPVGMTETKQGGLSVSVWPNPGKGIFNLLVKKISHPAEMVVTDPQGRIIYKEILIPENSMISEKIDLSRCTRGVYFLKITGENTSVVEKVVIN